jgi:Flp pilus assembly pilin Flp
MRTLFERFWQDETGSVTAEWAFVATILVLGAITGVMASRQAALADAETPAVVVKR